MATQPVEDIEAVLGRFQAWTGARNAVKAKLGIREFSDEEALTSGRYRWRSGGAGPVRPDKKVAAPQEPVAAPVASERSASGRSKAAAAKARNPKRSATKSHIKNHATAGQSAKSATKPVPSPKDAARPAFREVLAEAVCPAEVVVAQPMELSRQAAISIRLAPSERALIKTRAAEAGITASAYVRQCALEVEQLRAQVRAAVAAMERAGMVQGSSATSVAAPHPQRFFARMARRFFLRSAPAFALRA
ncbi:MAG: hypothetical protein WAM66_00065 [Acidobacteriaceae bacterium]